MLHFRFGVHPPAFLQVETGPSGPSTNGRGWEIVIAGAACRVELVPASLAIAGEFVLSPDRITNSGVVMNAIIAQMVYGKVALALLTGVVGTPCQDEAVFHAGPIFADFGKIADVTPDQPIPEGTRFKVRFDAGKQATPGSINSTLDMAARFINMHVEAGVPIENMELAVVVHGGAALDVTRSEFYAAKYAGQSNASAAALAELQQAKVQFFICGQSAAWQKISKASLLPGVQVALSAMTAHALLDQEGYSLNPF